MYDLTQALNVSDVGSNAEIDLDNLSLFSGPDAILGMFTKDRVHVTLVYACGVIPVPLCI